MPPDPGLLHGGALPCTLLGQEGLCAHTCTQPGAAATAGVKIRAPRDPEVEHQMCWIQSEAGDQAHSRLLAATSKAGHSFQRRPTDPSDRPVVGEEPA